MALLLLDPKGGGATTARVFLRKFTVSLPPNSLQFFPVKIPFFSDILTGKASLGETFQDFYQTFKSKGVKFGGVYWAFNPVLVPIDLKLIKDIMVKDFASFTDRG